MERSKLTLYLGAGVSFLVPLILYTITMQPTVPFWDCGEFAAAASVLGNPHPPGAPFWTLIGHFALLNPFTADPVAGFNFLSVLSASTTSLLLFLSFIRLCRFFIENIGEGLRAFAGVIAALCLVFSDSFWFNALECEVYAFGDLFLAVILWLSLRWYQNEKSGQGASHDLLLIAYLIGLSLGVHQLGLLMIFPVTLLIAMSRSPRFGWKQFLSAVVISSILFFVIYSVLLSRFISWIATGNWGLLILSLAALAVLWWVGSKRSWKNLQFALVAIAFIALGYSTYILVPLRASEHPPLNEGAPSTAKRLVEYLDRDQYGETKLLPRRLPEQRPTHEATWKDYTSDWDFFWRYQTNLMYTRYLAWNFVGRDGEMNGAGIDLSKTLAIPLLVGLLGLVVTFRRSPKEALVLLGMFLLLGVCTAWFQNQQEPQPRDRDYFYVGSFFIVALWIGLGCAWILERVRHKSTQRTITIGAAAALTILLPLNQCIGLAGLAVGKPLSETSKWAMYTRHNNRVPYEFGRATLESCDSNAVLFTSGDNDTFPLWCLQNTYGIRRDVRIVQLSLGTSSWYRAQLKNERPWNALPVDVAQGEPMALVKYGREEVASINGSVRWGSAIATVSDWLITDVVQRNIDSRPIYFTASVPEEEMAGLDKFVVAEGIVQRIVPPGLPVPEGVIAGVDYPRLKDLLLLVSSKQKASKPFQFSSYQDQSVHLGELDKEYGRTIRYAYIQLIGAALERREIETARSAFATMEAQLPVGHPSIEYPYASILASLAGRLGDKERFVRYANLTIEKIRMAMASPEWPADDRYAAMINAKYTLADLLFRTGRLDSARVLFEQLADASSGDLQHLYELRLSELEGTQDQIKGDFQGAILKYDEVLRELTPPNGVLSEELLELKARRDSLEEKVRKRG